MSDKIELQYVFRRVVERTNEPRTCLWCGDKLRPKYTQQTSTTARNRARPVYPAGYDPISGYDPDVKPLRWECKHPETGETVTGKTRAAVLMQIEPPKELQGYGDYADNAFCGLRCGYSFGVSLASLNYRLKP